MSGLRPSGGTAAYDAIVQSLPVIAKRSRERAALVLISDGADTASDATLRDIRSALLRSDAFVYAIAIDSPERQPIQHAHQSGGAPRDHVSERRKHRNRAELDGACHGDRRGSRKN
jgi:hypothetical protein